MEDDIKIKLDLIAECLYSKIILNRYTDLGLYNGEFGILLFLLSYSKNCKNDKYSGLIEEYEENLLGLLVERGEEFSFCSGFSGVLYLFEYLREAQLLDMDISCIQSDLDAFLILKMRQNIKCSYYDFMHGAIGIGLFFLKSASNLKAIDELIDFLYSSAEKDSINHLFKWRAIIDYENGIMGYNLSMSHGISSIIIFLSRAIELGIYNDKIQSMLTGAVNFVLFHQREDGEKGSYFPNYIPLNAHKLFSKSRLAWCYGDLGIGIALWRAGKALKHEEWEKIGFKILLDSTNRRNLEDNSIIDSGICHGSAGIAMIYNRMFIETQCQEFAEAAQYWLKQTLNFSCFEDGLAGYKTFFNDKWICDYSLLTGLSGIGMVLMSYLIGEQEWDEIFLLS